MVAGGKEVDYDGYADGGLGGDSAIVDPGLRTMVDFSRTVP